MEKKKEEHNVDYMKMSEVDAAYHILSKQGESMYYKELVKEVIKQKKIPVQSESNKIAEVYTLINMDSRFNFVGLNSEGKSMWGLTEWLPPEVKRGHLAGSQKSGSKTTKTNKVRKYETIQEDN